MSESASTGSECCDETQYLSKQDLQRKLNLPSTRSVDELVRRRKIPFVKLGYRTIRFVWPDVVKALEKLTVQPVGK